MLFRLQLKKMNEKMSSKMDMKFAVPLYMSRIFEIYCMKLETKVLLLNYNTVKMDQIDVT